MHMQQELYTGMQAPIHKMHMDAHRSRAHAANTCIHTCILSGERGRANDPAAARRHTEATPLAVLAALPLDAWGRKTPARQRELVSKRGESTV